MHTDGKNQMDPNSDMDIAPVGCRGQLAGSTCHTKCQN